MYIVNPYAVGPFLEPSLTLCLPPGPSCPSAPAPCPIGVRPLPHPLSLSHSLSHSPTHPLTHSGFVVPGMSA